MATNENALQKVDSNPDYVALKDRAAEYLTEVNKGIVIKTEEDAARYGEMAVNIAADIKRADAIRRFFTDPYNAFVKKLNDHFRPVVDQLGSANQTVRMRLSDYQTEKTRKAEEARLKALKDMNSGKISTDKAMERIEKNPEPPKTVRTEAATLSFRTDLIVEVEDATKVPAQYLIPNMAAIEPVAKALHKAKQQQIPGIKVTEKQVPIGRRSFG